MLEYTPLRTLHIVTVHMTLFLFVIRGYWMWQESPHLHAAWVRRLPHVNDTLLLLSALGMLWVGSLNPLGHPWLQAKIGGLLLYIILGSIALKRGRTKKGRRWALIGALVVFGYIVLVAYSKSVPWVN